jgi:hypothetical protein
MNVVTIGLLVVGTLVPVILFSGIARRREATAKREGTYANAFILVQDDGTARELTADERDHLNGDYALGDGNLPYIKGSYLSRTPDNRIGGYLLRRKLPNHVAIRK